MKKLAIMAIVALLVSGCCAGTNSTGKATKNPWNCVTNVLPKVQAVLCDPSVDQVADAISALAFLQTNPAIAAAVGVGIEVFRNIRDKICVTIPQLQSAISQFDTAVGTMALKGVEGYPVPKLSALRKAAAK
jgi:hypothetical protein